MASLPQSMSGNSHACYLVCTGRKKSPLSGWLYNLTNHSISKQNNYTCSVLIGTNSSNYRNIKQKAVLQISIKKVYIIIKFYKGATNAKQMNRVRWG